jgi:O-acetylserine/cysteine efflux transporter
MSSKVAVSYVPKPAVLVGLTALLFLIWSNSFVAISFVLGNEGVPARLDWLSLTTLRYCLAAIIAAVYCFAWRWQESLIIIRGHWPRLVAAGFFQIPAYNLCLSYGQQHGVPAPVASLETAIAPLFLMILGKLFLKEALSWKKMAGFVVAFVGLLLIASAKESSGGVPYPGLVAITALAPLSWAIYSVLSKPVGNKVSSILWTYLCIIVGTLPLFLLLPAHGLPAALALDATGWGALLFLSLLCTLFGFAAWTWMLKFIPASSIGFTIFLNPPMTTLSKALLATLLPATFAFQVVGREWLGGAIVCAGMVLALVKTPGSRRSAHK